jgi:hypothetical protein
MLNAWEDRLVRARFKPLGQVLANSDDMERLDLVEDDIVETMQSAWRLVMHAWVTFGARVPSK